MPFDALAWIDTTNRTHRPQRRSCLELANHLGGFFDNAELGTAGFVITEYLPRPPREAVQQLGAAGFVARYLAEIAQHGYRQAPLEQMAYGLEQRYRVTPQRPFKVMEEVKRHL